MMTLPLATVVAVLALAAVPLMTIVARLDADRWATAVAAVLSLEGALLVASVTLAPGAAEFVAVTPHLLVLVLLLAVLLALRASPRPGRATIVTGLVLLAVHHGAALPGVDVLAEGAGLLGAALVATGAARHLRRLLARLDAERDAREEELRLSELRRSHAAERDHELRNGLAGLAGAARLLGAGHTAADAHPDADHLDILVASELRRLHGLLRPSEQVRATAAATAYAVEPVLRGLVALRLAAGVEVRLETEPDLRAHGSPEVLAQVVVNLLANAERHAPGSPIRITTARRRDRVVVEVRDAGPGVGPGREELVLEPGVRDRRAGGHGLGLPLCRRLMAEEGGSVTVVPADPAEPGCRVVLDLPGAAPDGAPARAGRRGVGVGAPATVPVRL